MDVIGRSHLRKREEMKRLKRVIIVSLLSGVLCLGCTDADPNPVGSDESDQVNDSLSVEYIGHANTGCSGLLPKSNEGTVGAHLNGFQINGDTLTLGIHFLANCCPEFSEEFSFSNDTISIDVIDTRHDCDCRCPFDNEFSFHFAGYGDLFIHFRSIARYPGGDWCYSVLDTVITLPE